MNNSVKHTACLLVSIVSKYGTALDIGYQRAANTVATWAAEKSRDAKYLSYPEEFILLSSIPTWHNA